MDRILVDLGSVVDVISKVAFNGLRVKFTTLVEDATPMYEFGRSTIVLIGRVQLTMTVGISPHTQIIMMNFTVMDSFTSFQANLRSLFMIKSRAVMSSSYSKLKFPTGEDSGLFVEIKGWSGVVSRQLRKKPFVLMALRDGKGNNRKRSLQMRK